MIELLNGDCLNLMKQIPDKSIDMILCDLPYGTTKNKWDCPIDLKILWNEYKRIIKKRGAVVLFAQTPFDKTLGASNIEMLKYEWIWEKDNGTGHLNANYCPLKKHENILVFSESASAFVKDKSNAMFYYPQMSVGKPYKCVSGNPSKNYDHKNMSPVETVNDGVRFPTSILQFQRDKEKLHPTQKPVLLCEYLIKTYTSEYEIVLDNCMGSGTTGLACKNLNRHFIGIEKDDKYFEIAKKRIEGEL